ncbi:hypothetical protein Nepgr_030085 [Nepenthes gracilis]|uniref:Uncharacterized protein n=1 Tax=Nepenthes gracilis TaxID=150966 RepID=A0AAD3Y3L5_NEPGR|nr:hypothetical protein Nepgr_030085 [Nepenthes gracilis]
MAPDSSSPPQPPACFSSLSSLDLSPHDFKISSIFHPPRPATPWPLLPLSPVSPSPISSNPDFLPPLSVSCPRLPVRLSFSSLEASPSRDSALLPVAPVPIPILPVPQNSKTLLNPRLPSPSSPPPSTHDGFSPRTKSFAGFPSHSKLVDPLLNLESPSAISISANKFCGIAATSVTPVCPVGNRSSLCDPNSERLKSPRGVDSFSGSDAINISSLVDSGLLPSGLNTVVPPLMPEIPASDFLSQPAAPAASPSGCSWASVVENRTIGVVVAPETPPCLTVSSSVLANVVDPSTLSLIKNIVEGGCSRGDSESKISAPLLAEPIPLILRPVGLSPTTDTTDTPL